VVATGGSVVTDAESWQLLKRRSHTVWLKATPEDHWKRVLGQGDTRPMANRTSAMTELRSILSVRAPLYSEATQTIDTSSVRVNEAVRTIAAALRQKEEKVGRKAPK
jgi:XRE family aerobic/anaerobic benzoate catabolism transcriptional regulator